jgi:hypothetical protein
MIYEQQCPRCGEFFTGEEKDRVADDAVAHAAEVHGHNVDRDVIVAHLEGRRPDEG